MLAGSSCESMSVQVTPFGQICVKQLDLAGKRRSDAAADAEGGYFKKPMGFMAIVD